MNLVNLGMKGLMGMTALETINAFLFITQTNFNSVHLIVFCVVKVFSVLSEMKTTCVKKMS